MRYELCRYFVSRDREGGRKIFSFNVIYSDSKYQAVKRQRLQIDHLKIASEISLFLAAARRM